METETFWTLLTNAPHWEFELFLIFIFDVLIGILIWPRIKKFSKHHQDDDNKLAELERRIKDLENK